MFRKSILAGVVALMGLTTPAIAQEPDVKIAWTTWADSKVVSKLAAFVLDARGYDVELVLSDVEQQYRNLNEGNVDVMLMAWLKTLHAPYMAEYGENIEQVGIIYGPARVGLVVPNYVDSSINTVADLTNNAEMFGGKITGIDSGAGIMRLTRNAMQTYNIPMELKEGTGPRMTRLLERAYKKEEPIVVTLWNPHSIFANYDVRYLEDPDGVFGEADSVWILANNTLKSRQPEIYNFFQNYNLPIETVEAMMAEVKGTDADVEEVVQKWITENQATVNSWFN